MRFTIDTALERIIVPDTFFNQIDKMNAVLAAHGSGGNKIDPVAYVNDAIAKAQENALIRKADIPSVKKRDGIKVNGSKKKVGHTAGKGTDAETLSGAWAVFQGRQEAAQRPRHRFPLCA